MIKRLYEHEDPRKYGGWLTLWYVGPQEGKPWEDGRIVEVANFLHPSFYRHIRVMWRGRRWWALRYWLSRPVYVVFERALRDRTLRDS